MRIQDEKEWMEKDTIKSKFLLKKNSQKCFEKIYF